jgi:hypothetical protein
MKGRDYRGADYNILNMQYHNAAPTEAAHVVFPSLMEICQQVGSVR